MTNVYCQLIIIAQNEGIPLLRARDFADKIHADFQGYHLHNKYVCTTWNCGWWDWSF